MCINPGNTNEQVTLVPTEKTIIEKMGVEKIVVCTDGGLSSEDNRSFNSTADRSFITVQSLKKINDAYAAWSLQTKDWKLVPWTEAQKTARIARGLSVDDDPDMVFDLADEDTAKYYGNRTFYRERWIVNEKTKFSQRLIVTFSFKYRDYLRALRQRQIDIAETMVKKGTSGKKRQTSPARFLSEVTATETEELANIRKMHGSEQRSGRYTQTQSQPVGIRGRIPRNQDGLQSPSGVRLDGQPYQGALHYMLHRIVVVPNPGKRTGIQVYFVRHHLEAEGNDTQHYPGRRLPTQLQKN